jgi:hypothetical protein
MWQCGGEGKCIQGFGGETRRKDTTWNKVGVDGSIILKRILKKYEGRAWTGFIWLWIGKSGGLL